MNFEIDALSTKRLRPTGKDSRMPTMVINTDAANHGDLPSTLFLDF
ncbi:hypothetical protein V1290_005244 [Bradyrhizobium sp. AZCC 1578]|jgi:hypothetical protein